MLCQWSLPEGWAHYNKRITITSVEIQTAVRLHLPCKLLKHAASEGTKAVNDSKTGQDPPTMTTFWWRGSWNVQTTPGARSWSSKHPALFLEVPVLAYEYNTDFGTGPTRVHVLSCFDVSLNYQFLLSAKMIDFWCFV